MKIDTLLVRQINEAKANEKVQAIIAFKVSGNYRERETGTIQKLYDTLIEGIPNNLSRPVDHTVFEAMDRVCITADAITLEVILKRDDMLVEAIAAGGRSMEIL